MAKNKLIIAVASLKGGVGKTTTALHVANELARIHKVLVIDGDGTRSLLAYSTRAAKYSTPLPYEVCDEAEGMMKAVDGDYSAFIIDTPANPALDEIVSTAKRAHLTIIPVTPDIMGMDATVQILQQLKGTSAKYKVLLTMLPSAGTSAADTRASLLAANVPIFDQGIRASSAYRWAAEQGVVVGNAHTNSGRHKFAPIAASEYRRVTEEILNFAQS